MNERNPYTKPGCLEVATWFALDPLMLFVPGGAFDNIEQMLATFDHPELLEVLEVEGMKFLKLTETDVSLNKQKGAIP